MAVEHVPDLLGQPVLIGDRIAGAFRQADLAVIKVGEIVGFKGSGHDTKLVVRWDESSYGGLSGKTSQIQAHLRRFVRI